jgi:hypothetical protein
MPSFVVASTQFTIIEYCGQLERKELRINHDYQRGENVWPDAARSFLIESILLGYPIPKLSLWEVTNLKTKETVKEIIDGQQRTHAVNDFLTNKFSVSKRSEVVEARGATYDDLPNDLKLQFVSYRLTADVFTGATQEEIRELFRRINSYTVTLNPEEQRHAQYQGEMKWFIYELCRQIDPGLAKLGVFGEKQLARMQDAKLLADVIHAALYGIKTTKAQQLDELYRDFDRSFKRASEFNERIQNAFALLQPLDGIANTEITKQHNFYSLLLAVMHVSKPLQTLRRHWKRKGKLLKKEQLESALLHVAGILAADDPPAGAQALWKAANEKTNTWDHRVERFKGFCRAVSQQ